MFPRNSAWRQHEERQAMEQAAGIQPPLRTPEENQRLAAERKPVTMIPTHVLEDWIERVGYVDDGPGQDAVLNVADEMRSYLRG